LHFFQPTIKMTEKDIDSTQAAEEEVDTTPVADSSPEVDSGEPVSNI